MTMRTHCGGDDAVAVSSCVPNGASAHGRSDLSRRVPPRRFSGRAWHCNQLDLPVAGFGSCLTHSMSLHAPLIARMEEIGAGLASEDDPRQFFHMAYLRSTKSVMKEVEDDGFMDSAWAESWGIAFADLYLDALEAWDRGDDAPGPWQVAFDASRDHDLEPLTHVLLGINAHINYDLPQALLAVITDAEFDDEAVLQKRSADHAHVDSILAGRVSDEDRSLEMAEQPGTRTMLDNLLRPAYRVGTRRFLKEGREKVWRNARVLSAARRGGSEALARQMEVLERLCQQRVADLITPRFVLLHLAMHGFGVLLPEPED